MNNDLTYTHCGDYSIPGLTLSESCFFDPCIKFTEQRIFARVNEGARETENETVLFFDGCIE